MPVVQLAWVATPGGTLETVEGQGSLLYKTRALSSKVETPAPAGGETRFPLVGPALSHHCPKQLPAVGFTSPSEDPTVTRVPSDLVAL